MANERNIDIAEDNVEVLEEETVESGEVQLPVNFLSFGEIQGDDVKVYIKQDVYKALEKYASSNTEKELGTILVGEYCEAMGNLHVVISDYIEAKYTDASSATLTFTHKTWEYVHKQHDRLHPEKKIIGWQHTHPNYGIFLSNYDLFIQENFFNLPFQVAYVIDPVQNLRGFFQWKDGKTEKLKGYYVYDEVGKPIKIEQVKRGKNESQPEEPAVKRRPGLVPMLCVLALAVGIFGGAMLGKMALQERKQEQIEELIAQQEQEIYELRSQLYAVEQGAIGEKTVTFEAYAVEAGDTLCDICETYGIDYEANKNILLSINGIEDPNGIYAGQTILLPVS